MENFSLSDIATAVCGGRGNCNGDGGLFGGGYGGILALIIIFVLLFGRGGLGGGYGNEGRGFTDAEIQRGFDNSNVVNKLDGIANGLCDSTFALNNAVNSGFANANLTNVTGFNSVNGNIANLGYQLQQCCCETNRNIDAVRYENAKNTCDIINAGNANTQRIVDTITNNTIQELRDNLQAAQLQLGNLSQTSTIINAVRPFPTPAYITCSPYQSALGLNGVGYNGYQCGSSVGCNLCNV